MRHEIKQFALMLCLLLSATWCCGNDTTEGYSHIQIKESHVQGVPKGNSIQATIEGHVLSVVFLEVRMVEEIANAGCGYSQSLAEVLLSRVSDRISDLSCLDLPNTESDRNAASFSGVPSEDGSGPTIEITPNPATTRISIEYSIPSGMEFAELVLSNIMGMIVLNAELHGSQGQKTLDVSGLANGIYYYVFRCGEIVKTGKIVIAK